MWVVRRIGIAVAGLALCAASAAVKADVVVVVATSSPVKTLARNQVADIFLGKTSRFPGGGQATPIDQTEDSPTRDEFYTTFTGKSASQLKAHWSKIIFTGRGQPPQAVSSSAEVKKRVAENPDTIGYIDAREVDGSVRALPIEAQ
ncbi:MULTISPECIES: substrate-binding domain-containing protein [Pseudomonas]|uniref:Phosphate ABC transporter substrate-binding protein n=1 Tax=Pseudomonas bijieensis TaxID=2681983 RepID=A0A6N1C9B8_9PSED|nr:MULTISPECIES: substrate-binding domain-containing protein [Pseudomonas]AXP03749.1 phosphate ABC transporter substrate-binding protein [Pseudomonas fluorescens]MCD9118458.1 substrate-binding domain-containing protein [Pseudomonas bijieensis]PWJ38881.1 periplasmic binding family protein [Pseudomonas sp. 43mfcvi1.1]QIB08170.1 phosphate ABC transporter substrate-binding protein [Pseudomonas fluorescens]QKS80577.1 phosphate ABC transporter substrate-binding protein [Pseudomonas bijieensis]